MWESLIQITYLNRMFSSTITILLIICYLLAGTSIVFYTLKNGISPMPTSTKVKKDLLSMIKGLNGKPNSIQRIYELGSGTGSLSCAISRQMTSATVIACENSPIPYVLSVIRAKLTRCQNLILKRENFDQLNITPAELIICYLSTEIMVNLSSKLKKELRPGSFIISHTFALPEWTPEKIIYVNDFYRTPIYLYRVQ